MYIHQQPDWPKLKWRSDEVANKVTTVRQLQCRLLHRFESVDLPLIQETVLDTLTSLVMKSSEKKGPNLYAKEVYKAVACRLGWGIGASPSANPNMDGIVDLMLDATGNYGQPLTAERLFRWHASLFPSQKGEGTSITANAWRDDHNGPMKIVPPHRFGDDVVDFEAPAAVRIKHEMEGFLDWFNGPDESDIVLKAGLAHLRFVAIHPFCKGNGRIAWAIREMTLARFDDNPHRFYTMSSQLRLDQQKYNNILKRTGKGTTDVTEWLSWFVECLEHALEYAHVSIDRKINMARLRDRLSPFSVNETQRKVLERLIGDGENEFTLRKWRKIAGYPIHWALPDIDPLVHLGILAPLPGETRNARYVINDN